MSSVPSSVVRLLRMSARRPSSARCAASAVSRPFFTSVGADHRDVVLRVAGDDAGAAADAARQVDHHRPARVAVDVLAVLRPRRRVLPPDRSATAIGSEAAASAERRHRCSPRPGSSPRPAGSACSSAATRDRLGDLAIVLHPHALLEEPRPGVQDRPGASACRTPVGWHPHPQPVGREAAGGLVQRGAEQHVGVDAAALGVAAERLVPEAHLDRHGVGPNAGVDVRRRPRCSRSGDADLHQSPCSTPSSLGGARVDLHPRIPGHLGDRVRELQQPRPVGGAAVEEAVRRVDDQVEVRVALAALEGERLVPPRGRGRGLRAEVLLRGCRHHPDPSPDLAGRPGAPACGGPAPADRRRLASSRLRRPRRHRPARCRRRGRCAAPAVSRRRSEHAAARSASRQPSPPPLTPCQARAQVVVVGGALHAGRQRLDAELPATESSTSPTCLVLNTGPHHRLDQLRDPRLAARSRPTPPGSGDPGGSSWQRREVSSGKVEKLTRIGTFAQRLGEAERRRGACRPGCSASIRSIPTSPRRICSTSWIISRPAFWRGAALACAALRSARRSPARSCACVAARDGRSPARARSPFPCWNSRASSSDHCLRRSRVSRRGGGGIHLAGQRHGEHAPRCRGAARSTGRR